MARRKPGGLLLVIRDPAGVASPRLQSRYLLIYGGKDENAEEITRLRQYIHAEHPNISTLTYDHLAPIEKHRDYLSLRGDGAGRFKAVAMPGTARLTPDHADWWELISDRADMVESNPWISAERKGFLLDYLHRCDAWADAYDDIHQQVFGWRPGEHGGAPA